MPNADVAWVDVLPSMKGFGPALSKEVGNSATAVGTQAGRQFGSSFGGSAVDGVQAASAKMSAALRSTADAAGKVNVAETRLKELRESGKATATQIVTAEENLARARRNETGANEQLSAATRKVRDAQNQHTEASRQGSVALQDTEKKAGLLTRTFGSMHGAVVAGFAAFSAARGAVNFVTGAIGAARDLGETVSKSNTIFGSNAAAVDAWAKTAARSMGLSRAAALDTAAGFGNMFTQLGWTSEGAAKLSMEVTQMSADLGSFNNMPTADVADRISAAFRGEYDSLQQLIPNISDARVKSEALAMTGKDNADALTAQEKAAAVLAIVHKDGAKAMGDFERTSGKLANSQRILSAEWDNSKARLGELLVGPMTAIVKWTSSTLLPVVGGAWDEITRGFTAFAAAWKYNDGDITSSGFPGLMERIAYWAHQAWDVLNEYLIPAVKTTAGFFVNNEVALYGLVGAFVAWKVAMAAGSAALAVQTAGGLMQWVEQTQVAKKLSAAWAATQWLLNASFYGFPLVWILAAVAAVIAGIVLLWRNSETFRDIVLGTWEAVQTGIRWAWESVIKPTWSAMQAAWSATVIAAQWAWDHILRPMWDVLMATATFMFNWLNWSVFIPIQIAWAIMTALIKQGYEHVLRPTWDAVAAAAGWLWRTILEPIFGWIASGWNLLLRGMDAVWQSVLRPAFDAIKTAVGWVKDAFDGAVNGISTAWERMRAIVAAPINFVIRTVLRDGLFSAWNWVLDKLGVTDWHIDLKANWLQGIAGYATGGRIKGFSPTDTADNVPIMATAGEYMQPVSAVRGYGVEAMDAVRRGEASIYYARGGWIPGYATGGQIFDLVKSQFPEARFTSGYRPGDSGYHGKNMAADVGGPSPAASGSSYMAAIKRWWYDNFGGATEELIYNGAFNDRSNLLNGKPYPYSAATQAEHRNHVHIAESGPLGAAGFAGASASGTAAVTNPWYVDLWQTVTGAKDWLFGKLGDVGQLTSRFGDSTLTQGLWSIAAKTPGILWDKIKDTISGLFSSPTSSGSAAADPDVKKTIMNVFGEKGWGTGAQWNATDWIIGKESGWNPTAQNPVSTASGLFQHINATWNASKRAGVTAARMRDASVLEQGYGGRNYIERRYGTPTAAQAYWQAHGNYAGGGLIMPQLLDRGGLWEPGIGFNLTGTTERVLSPEQDTYFRRFVDVAESAGMGGQVPVWHFYLGDEEITSMIDARVEYRTQAETLDVRSSRRW